MPQTPPLYIPAAALAGVLSLLPLACQRRPFCEVVTDACVADELGTTESGGSSDSTFGEGSDGSDTDTDEGSGETTASETGCSLGMEGCGCDERGQCALGLQCQAGTCVVGFCGDGIVDPREACDDGNQADSDGCNADCTVTKVVEISAGGFYTCALSNSGDVKCWGRADYGQLGQANTSIIGYEETPAAVPPIELGAKAVAIAAGSQHSCALLETAEVMCWGRGLAGRLGYANTDNIGDNETPSAAGTVEAGGSVSVLAVGNTNTCVILESGFSTCWGSGTYALGRGANAQAIGDDEHPASVGVLDVGGVLTAIDVGSAHTCVIREDQAVLCWGSNSYGQLGIGTTTTYPYAENATPINFGMGFSDPSSVRVSNHTSCAASSAGLLTCWGRGSYGSLGYGAIDNVGDNEHPTATVDLPSIAAVDNALQHTCAITDGGDAYCWGSGTEGQLGYPGQSAVSDPASMGPIDLGGSAIAVATSRFHNCALLTTGEVVCWGTGQYGAIGYGSPQNIGDDETPASAGVVEVF